VFFDPSRSHSDPSIASSIVASCSRDGNILIYDLRCQGRAFRNGSEESSASEPRRSSRERYSAGVPGFVAQQTGCNLDPVMVVRQAHGDSSRRASSSGVSVAGQSCRAVLMRAENSRQISHELDRASSDARYTCFRRFVRRVSSLQSLRTRSDSCSIVKLWDLRFPASTARSPDPRPICTPFGELPDPTIQSRSRRPRSVNALVESPVNGDLYALCGDSKVHVLRPSAYSSCEEPPKSEAIQPRIYTDPDLLVSSFYIRMAISPDGRYLSSGSCKGGVMSWETQEQGYDGGQMKATRLSLGTGGVAWPEGREREVSAVDWGKDLVSLYQYDQLQRRS